MSLQVFCGPMFSGKTSRMISEINKFIDIDKNYKAIIINHKLDTRDVDKIVSSHSSLYKGLNDKIDIITTSLLSEIDVSNYTIIGIDEINFYENEQDLVSTIENWLAQEKHIICAGLDGNHKMGKFGYISSLLHLSDDFVKLSAVCDICVKEILSRGEMITPRNITPAPFTKKIINDGNLIEIGGADKYIPVCRKHHSF